MSRSKLLDDLRARIKECRRCSLWKGRTNAVPGDGNPEAEIMFIGEAPGYHEDLQGKPFVGAAGKLLTELIRSIGLEREEVYITNVVKCRPPGNRDPKPEEIASCSPYLDEEILIIKPRIIVTLGRHSTGYILAKGGIRARAISKVRGRAFELDMLGLHVIVFPTYHPAAALYNPRLKAVLVKDFEAISKLLNKTLKRRISLDQFF